MGTVAAEINRVREVEGRPYQEAVQELTNLVVRRTPYFRRMALRRLGNMADAEDAVQDAFLSAYAHLDQFKGRAKMSTWLTKIVTNSARMKVRSTPFRVYFPLDRDNRNQDNPLPWEMLSDGRPSPEETCRRCELMEHLAQLSRRLPPTLRRTLQLRIIDDLSIRETARVLGVSDGAVKARVSRARARLKQLAHKDLAGECGVV